jgi:hypothetical protein
LQKSSLTLKTARLDALESSYSELENTIHNIPNDAMLAQAQTDIYLAALNTLAYSLSAGQVTCKYMIVDERNSAELLP